MALILYTLSAAAILFLAHRYVERLSLAACLVLYLLPFCFTGRALLTNGVYGPIDIAYATEPLLAMRDEMQVGSDYSGVLGDIAYQMIPWRKAVQWSLANGEWPLWNPFILSGDILAAAGQPAAYSPFTLIAVLLPIGAGLTYTAAMVFFVAGCGAFLFARALGCSWLAALLPTAGWMYSTGIAFFGLWPLGFSWAFLPAVLLGGLLVVRDPSLRSAVVLGTALLLLVLAGHPETALHVVFVGAVFSVAELAASRRHVIRSIAVAFAAGIAVLGLTAIYLLPLLEAAPQTIEHPYRTNVFAVAQRGAPAVVVAARIATDLLPFMHVRQWRIEGVHPFSAESGAVGSIVLALALYAFVSVRSRQTWFFGGLAIFGLLAAGNFTPVARFLQKLPLFDIALNERLVFASGFSLALLSGFAVDALLQRVSRRRAALGMLLVLVILGAATAWLHARGIAGPNVNRWGDHKIAAELILLAVAILLLLPRLAPPVFVSLLLALVLVQRTVSESGIYPTYPQRAAYPPIPLLEPLASVETPFRVVGFNLALIPGTSALYELEDVRGYQAMTFARYYTTYPLWCLHQPVWFNKVIDLTKPFLSFLNVRYAISYTNQDPPEGWRLVGEDATGRLFENLNVIDRVFAPATVRVGASDAEALTAMASVGDFREKAWIAAEGAPYDRINGPAELSVRRRGTAYEIDALMHGAGWLVLSENAWKGWRAYIDGERVRTTIANTSFVSVFVPQGRHRVRLVYWPESFVWGRGITFLTMAVLAGLAAARVLRRSNVMRSKMGMIILIAIAAAGCQQETAQMTQDTPRQTEAPVQRDVRGTAANTGTMNPTVPPQTDAPHADPTGVAPATQGVHLIEYAIHMPQTLNAGRHTFRVENGGKEMHSFEIEGNGVHAALPSPLSRASTTSLDVNLPPGTYTVYCPIKGHRERGMEMKLTVR